MPWHKAPRAYLLAGRRGYSSRWPATAVVLAVLAWRGESRHATSVGLRRAKAPLAHLSDDAGRQLVSVQIASAFASEDLMELPHSEVSTGRLDLPELPPFEVSTGARGTLWSVASEPSDHRMLRPGDFKWVVDGLADSVPVVLGFSLLGLLVFSLVSDSRKKDEEDDTDYLSSPCREWSVMAVVALTSYRFYTGFLSATWMPYLLAMEGDRLTIGAHGQSVFMGTAKLIYGLSILLNPIFGLLGDHMAVMSHWSGRRLFLLAGVSAGSLGIYGCLTASRINNVGWYLASTVLWMLGEAIADVTTETLVPELLPKSQFDLSSNIRALNFLLGGLSGYVCLIAFRHLRYSWLYYAYLIVCIVCAFCTLLFINKEVVKTKGWSDTETGLSFKAMLKQAYVGPSRYEGGFPRACMCLFVFSLGSAPMFFLLLMVRDIVGVSGQAEVQLHFSFISIAFFVAAALASILGALIGHGAGDDDQAMSRASSSTRGAAGATAVASPRSLVASPRILVVREPRAVVVWRWRLMVGSTVLFGVVVALIPTAGLISDLSWRIPYFYLCGTLLGFSFGSVYARFQECTWSVLPSGVDIANAMGYAAMCKLAGVGIGNFVVGFILDAFVDRGDHRRYQFVGYVIMHAFCAIVVLCAAMLAQTISWGVLKKYDESVAHQANRMPRERRAG